MAQARLYIKYPLFNNTFISSGALFPNVCHLKTFYPRLLFDSMQHYTELHHSIDKLSTVRFTLVATPKQAPLGHHSSLQMHVKI